MAESGPGELPVQQRPLSPGWEACYRGLHALVTGGLGFIGSNVARRLVHLGARVTIVDSLIPQCGGNLWNIHDIEENVEKNIVDLRDREKLERLVRKKDIIFNLAGQVSHIDSMEDPFQDLEINCLSQLSLLEACRKENPEVKIIYAGTRQQYGKPQYLPVDENHPLRPTDVNGINKAAAETYHLLYHQVHGIRTVSLRLTNTYGPGLLLRHSRQGFLAVFLRTVLEGGEINVFGTGEQLRDLTYVEDVVESFLRVAVAPWTDGEVYNLGGTEKLPLKEVAERLIKVAGRGSLRLVPFPKEARRIDIGSYYGSFEKIRTAVDWQPRVSTEAGLSRTVEYYGEHIQHYL
jgi:UDP-glucose 4-epimerase